MCRCRTSRKPGSSSAVRRWISAQGSVESIISMSWTCAISWMSSRTLWLQETRRNSPLTGSVSGLCFTGLAQKSPGNAEKNPTCGKDFRHDEEKSDEFAELSTKLPETLLFFLIIVSLLSFTSSVFELKH